MEQNQIQEVQPARARIELPTAAMVRVKTPAGGISFHCGDAVAALLSGLSLTLVKELSVGTFGFDVAKYDHLNPGQQRMTLGNLMRTVLRKQPEFTPTFEAAAGVIRAANAEEVAANEKVLADAAAEKLAKKEATAAEKAEKAEAKAKKAADKEANGATTAQEKADKKAAADKEKADKAEAKLTAKADKKAAADKEKADKAATKLADAAAKAKAKADKAAAEAEAVAQRGRDLVATADAKNAETLASQAEQTAD